MWPFGLSDNWSEGSAETYFPGVSNQHLRLTIWYCSNRNDLDSIRNSCNVVLWIDACPGFPNWTCVEVGFQCKMHFPQSTCLAIAASSYCWSTRVSYRAKPNSAKPHFIHFPMITRHKQTTTNIWSSVPLIAKPSVILNSILNPWY